MADSTTDGGECSLKIVAFLQNDGLHSRVQDLVERACQEGHQITIFGQQLVPISEPSSDTLQPYAEENLHQAATNADVLLLLTSDDAMSYIPPPVRGFMDQHENQGYFSWSAFGMTCRLIGGSVHSRKVAMNLRQLLDDSDYPFFGRVLPEPCRLRQCYNVDPACETGQECVL